MDKHRSIHYKLDSKCDKRKTLLSFPDYNKQFILNTDGSATAIDAILYQAGKIIEIFSRKLSVSQCNFTYTDRELLAIVEAPKYFRSMIYGTDLIIKTDNINLLHSPDLETSRAQRWKLLIEEYGIKITYEPVKSNQAADMLSRCAKIVDNKPKLKASVLQLVQNYQSSSTIQLDNKGRAIIPEHHTKEFVLKCHDILGHPGISSLFYTLQRFFWIKNLKSNAKIVRKEYYKCQKYQIGRHNYSKLTGNLQSDSPSKHLASDILGPIESAKFIDKHKHSKFWILTIIDRCTHWVQLYTLYDIKPLSVINCIIKWISKFGKPQSFLSD